MKFLTKRSLAFSSLLASVLAVSTMACTTPPISQPTVNVSPSIQATSNNPTGQQTITVTPQNTPQTQPVVGPMTPPVVTPVTVPPIQNTLGSYPNSNLLVDTKWLAAHLPDQNLVIIDTRPASTYAAGHITGAVNLGPALFDMANAAGDTSLLKSSSELADIFGKAGVSDTNRIIVYSSGVDANAGRVFWALENLGHKDVHVLDGGYTQWNKEGNYAVLWNSIRTATTFTPTVNASVIATKANELASLNNTNVIRVDSRNAADFIVKRIPNSINILMADYLNADGTVKSFGDMTTFLNSKGIAPGKTVIANCYVGYRSSQAYFIFSLMGYNVSNYDGSTTEWFADTSLPTQP
ncbi:MAG: rhodanese-like domain-containing protein [Dehalococcoidales bacterium]|nr:rhodanese-like domain-containing protein [Dehalococcoidales bacterium]